MMILKIDQISSWPQNRLVNLGESQAINAGDCMFSLAFQSLVHSSNQPENVISAVDQLQETCTSYQGQFLDMAFESKDDLPLDAYWTMVGGKTASLLACSAAIGATITGADHHTIDALQRFAWNLGLAFQVQDDWLGIWGDSALIGKSTESDLMNGKKSLPIIMGLSASPEFRERWANRPFQSEEIPKLAELIKKAGVQKMVEVETSRLTDLAKNALYSLPNQNDAVSDLMELAELLLNRKK